MPGTPDRRSENRRPPNISSRTIRSDQRSPGGEADPCPKQDYGFIYARSFEDLDGHVIEPMWMDFDAALAAMGSRQTEAA